MCKKTLAELDEGMESLKRSANGEGLIRLGFLRPLGTRYIPQLASQFLKENAGKNIDFSFHTDRTQPLLNGLLEKKYDLVFCSQPEDDMNVISIPVMQQKLVVIVPKDHPLAQKKKIDLAEAANYPQIYFAEGSGLRNVIDALFQKVGKSPMIAYETEEDQVIAGLVAAGFGIGIVPYMDLLLKLDVAILAISTPPYKREFFMVQNKEVFLPPVSQQFWDYVSKKMNR